MKVSDSTRFPHPVLSALTGDYPDLGFGPEITAYEHTGTEALRLRCSADMPVKAIADSLENGSARWGLFVICRDTYFSQLFPLDYPEQEISIAPGKVWGDVELLPVVWAEDGVGEIPSSEYHEEFGEDAWAPASAEILALGDIQWINVGREKLAPIDSIFSMARDNSVPAGQFRLSLEGPEIQICAERRTYSQLHELRNMAQGRKLLLNALYLPAVMEVLSNIKSDPGLFEEKRWFRVMRAKCDHAGIEIDSCQIFEAAQELLRSPFIHLAALSLD